MGLLDNDAEDLKDRAKRTGTGRKVNQSGLGAFKSLSKYSILTAKYRETEKSKESKSINENVPQECSTPPEVTSNLPQTSEVKDFEVTSELLQSYSKVTSTLIDQSEIIPNHL
ncbi:MAG TPA: hypothetical protein PLJ21_09485 [Pseudobdellovibrionaceae bacterium]|nr:hypothetical protein [Pseudobdellovibrionaceae bacterium]